MNVFRDLCTPLLESIVSGTAFDLVVPQNGHISGFDIDSILDEDDGQVDQGKVNGKLRRLSNPDECKAYAQLMVVIALVVELKAG